MPRIIDYPQVSQQLTSQGLICLYFNSGAFGFPEATPTQSLGWIGADDSTIRPAALALARKVSAPTEPTLADLATRAWLDDLPGVVWVTPKSHWAYELDFGSPLWMPAALSAAGVSEAEVSELSSKHDGTALAFAPDESTRFQSLLLALLSNLFGSDFLLTFPGRNVVCTIHHHKQLWWTTSDAGTYALLNAMVK